ncbi:MAG: hypothetical protein Q8R20_02920 [Nanoarchaeota archaeon]|nr:hypothetical protein [Nanoarchaeota archaeon]
MENEDDTWTPFKLTQRIRRRVPELFKQCGQSSVDLNGWFIRGDELLPERRLFKDEDKEGLEDVSEVEVEFYLCLLRGQWLLRIASIAIRLNVGYNGQDLISSTFFAWEIRLRELLEDACSNNS